MARVTNEDIIKRLEHLEDNECRKEIHNTVNKLVAQQQAHTAQQERQFSETNKHIRSLEKRLYNPDDGVIVKINKLMTFKGTITKSLWVMFAALTSLAAATINNLFGK